MRTLTKEGRLKITNAVLAHALKERVERFIAEESSLLKAIVDRIYPQEIQDHMQALIDFHKGMPFQTFDRLTVSVGGQRMPVGYIRSAYDQKSIEISVERLIGMVKAGNLRTYSTPVLSYFGSSHEPILTVEQGDELGDRVSRYWEERSALKADVNSKRGSIMGILAHIKNEAQLKAKWPEIMPIAEQSLTEAKAPAPQVPMVMLQDLNASLGLPPETVDEDVRELEQA